MIKKMTFFLFLTAGFSLPACAAEINFSEQIAEGGVAILVIIALSILALTVTIERLRNFRKKNIIPDGLVEKVKPLWRAGEFAQIQALLAHENNTLARVIDYMVVYRHQEFALVSNSVGDIASLELRHHQQKAYALAIVATVAPIVGLLGTVIGMIEAFHVIAYSEGMGNPALLAGGISKALINTASGLSVALPALGLHHFFKNRASFLSMALEKQINQLLNEWFMPVANATPNLQVISNAH